MFDRHDDDPFVFEPADLSEIDRIHVERNRTPWWMWTFMLFGIGVYVWVFALALRVFAS